MAVVRMDSVAIHMVFVLKKLSIARKTYIVHQREDIAKVICLMIVPLE